MDKKEKKQSKGGAIAVGIIMLLSAIDGIAGDGEAVAIVIVLVVTFFALFAIAGAAKKKKAKPQSSAVKTEKKEQKAASYAQNSQEKKYYQAERKYYDSDCQMMSSAHDHDRRLEQLDGFLQNGLISLKEYNILKNKYGG